MRRLVLRTLCALVPMTASAQYDHLPARISALAPAAAPALRLDLGRHHHRISTDSSRAQEFFDQGMRWLWAANGSEAAASFAAAEAIDPSCAMCAWGIAAALTIPSGEGPGADGRSAAREAIRRARERRAVAWPVEVALIDAQALRLEDDRRSADSAYVQAMRDVLGSFPDHYEVQVLYADALLSWSHHRDVATDGSADAVLAEIERSLQDVLSVNADHPGACHLFVHLMEQREPARALQCADQLATTMAGSRHLARLPLVLQVRAGRYADAIAAGETLLRPGSGKSRAAPMDPRDSELLAFAATMAGASRRAIRYASTTRANDVPRSALTLTAFGRWSEVLELPIPTTSSRVARGLSLFARGSAFAAKNRWAEAQVILDSVRDLAAREPRETRLAIAVEALAGELEFRRGRRLAAIEHFTAAVALSDKLANVNTPGWHVPLRHSLGRVLLAAGRATDAERTYRQDLDRNPENGWSLHGLAESLLAQGRRREAREALARFARAWAGADVQLRGSGI